MSNLATVFNIVDVFKAFYRDACYEVHRTALLVHEGSTNMVLPSSFLNTIKSQLGTCFSFVDLPSAYGVSLGVE